MTGWPDWGIKDESIQTGSSNLLALPSGDLFQSIYFSNSSNKGAHQLALAGILSSDGGREWRFLGMIAPTLAPTLQGPSESASVVTQSGNVLVVFRVMSQGPKTWYNYRSTVSAGSDEAGLRRWTLARPLATTPIASARPKLQSVRLPDGSLRLLLAGGRPSLTLYMSLDGEGERWAPGVNIAQLHNKHFGNDSKYSFCEPLLRGVQGCPCPEIPSLSCELSGTTGYTSLVPLHEPGRFLFVYDKLGNGWYGPRAIGPRNASTDIDAVFSLEVRVPLPRGRAARSKAPAGGALPMVAADWSWDRLQTFTYGTNRTCDAGSSGVGCNESGVDSPSEVDWKLKYDLVMIGKRPCSLCLIVAKVTRKLLRADNSGSTYGFGNSANCLRNSSFAECNRMKSMVAAAIRKADPSKPVTVYRETLDCGLAGNGSAPLASPDDEWLNPLTHKRVRYRDIWFVDDSGVLQPGKCDLRKREAQDYVLTHNYFGDGTEPSSSTPLEFLRDENITGIFVDSGILMGVAPVVSTFASNAANPAPISVGTRRGLFNGTATLFKRAADMLGAEGKFLTVSLKAHFSSIAATGGGTSGGIICDPSEPDGMIYNFTARRTNCYDQAWCDCFPCTPQDTATLLRAAQSLTTTVARRRRGCACRDHGLDMGAQRELRALPRVQHTVPRLREREQRDDGRGDAPACAGPRVRRGNRRPRARGAPRRGDDHLQQRRRPGSGEWLSRLRPWAVRQHHLCGATQDQPGRVHDGDGEGVLLSARDSLLLG